MNPVSSNVNLFEDPTLQMLTTFVGELMLRNFKVLRNKIVIILSMSRIFENALGQPIIRVFIFILLDYWLGGLTSC